MREVYRERRDALVEALESRLGGRLTVLEDRTGLHLTARFSELTDDEAVESVARDRGLGPLALSPFYESEAAVLGLVLGFGGTPVEEIGPGVEVLADALDDLDGR